MELLDEGAVPEGGTTLEDGAIPEDCAILGVDATLEDGTMLKDGAVPEAEATPEDDEMPEEGLRVKLAEGFVRKPVDAAVPRD